MNTTDHKSREETRQHNTPTVNFDMKSKESESGKDIESETREESLEAGFQKQKTGQPSVCQHD
jgi:hypothetical protein